MSRSQGEGLSRGARGQGAPAGAPGAAGCCGVLRWPRGASAPSLPLPSREPASLPLPWQRGPEAAEAAGPRLLGLAGASVHPGPQGSLLSEKGGEGGGIDELRGSGAGAVPLCRLRAWGPSGASRALLVPESPGHCGICPTPCLASLLGSLFRVVHKPPPQGPSSLLKLPLWRCRPGPDTQAPRGPGGPPARPNWTELPCGLV